MNPYLHTLYYIVLRLKGNIRFDRESFVLDYTLQLTDGLRHNSFEIYLEDLQ